MGTGDLLAEAVYSTILPGERDELHATLAEELARTGAASPAELASHWAACGSPSRRRWAASVRAARQAEAGFGLAEDVNAHLERVLALWADVPDASELAGLALPDLCAWTADLARLGGRRSPCAGARTASDRAHRRRDPHRAALLQVGLGEDLSHADRQRMLYPDPRTGGPARACDRPRPSVHLRSRPSRAG